MSTARKRIAAPRLAKEQRVEEILVAARDVFCEKGYEAVTVAQIAEHLGVVEGLIFKYFSTKRQLLLKVLEHWYEEMFGDYARDLAGVNGHRARLRLLIWRHLRTVRDYPLLCRLMFREVRSEDDYRGTTLYGMNRRYTEFLVEVITQGAAAGEFRADLPPTLLRDLVYGGIEHATWNYICGRGGLDIDTLAEHITAVLCEGIAMAPATTELHQEMEQKMKRLSQIASRIEKALPKK